MPWMLEQIMEDILVTIAEYDQDVCKAVRQTCKKIRNIPLEYWAKCGFALKGMEHIPEIVRNYPAVAFLMDDKTFEKNLKLYLEIGCERSLPCVNMNGNRLEKVMFILRYSPDLYEENMSMDKINETVKKIYDGFSCVTKMIFGGGKMDSLLNATQQLKERIRKDAKDAQKKSSEL